MRCAERVEPHSWNMWPQAPGDPGDLWEWLLEQSQEELLELLAVVTDANINAVEAKHDHDGDWLAHADQLSVAMTLAEKALAGKVWIPARLRSDEIDAAAIAAE